MPSEIDLLEPSDPFEEVLPGLEMRVVDPESLEEDPLLELLDFLPDSRLSVR